MIVDQAFQITNGERFRHDLAENARAELIGNIANERAFSPNESILSNISRKAGRLGATPGCAGSSP